MIAELLSAATLGLLTSISPCPLATNIAAVSFVGRHARTPARSWRAALGYVLGRTLCYTALAAALTAGLLAATAFSTGFARVIGLLVGPILVVAGAMLLGLLPSPSFGGGASALGERLARRGDVLGAFLLGSVFALSFCPASAAIFFGSLVPLATESRSSLLVPAVYGAATGVPVLVFAVLLATGGHRIGRFFDRIAAVERWMRIATGIVLIGVGASLSIDTTLGS